MYAAGAEVLWTVRFHQFITKDSYLDIYGKFLLVLTRRSCGYCLQPRVLKMSSRVNETSSLTYTKNDCGFYFFLLDNGISRMIVYEVLGICDSSGRIEMATCSSHFEATLF
ncbi:hypothetical protein AVEN_147852-1 [Araneus ventricosus]|uniref:Uncharacterized protein n=1 Tax=Araneus ventricosus TaxID=182803 RepID=A0A4Y2CUH0_ARAVE|nr:hypothetical protein AVEN_147852-1 [Araneus ventricosus]